MSPPSEKIIFYDIKSNDPIRPCSPNTLKARCLLNFKGLNFETVTMRYPEIDSKMTDLGAPRKEQYPHQALPVIYHPRNGLIQESKEIAKFLDKTYPDTPGLSIEDESVNEALDKIRQGYMAIILPIISVTVHNYLDDESLAFYKRTRRDNFGLNLDELAKDINWDKVWQDGKTAFEPLYEIMSKNNGPFILGEKATYADIVLVSIQKFIQISDQELFSNFQKLVPHGRFEKLWEAGKDWTK